jgi:cation transport ATPase
VNQTFKISGMHCGNCVGKVTAALKPFADDVTVTLNPPQAVLRNAKSVAEGVLQSAVARASAYQISPNVTTKPIAPSATGDDAEPSSWLSTYQPLLLIAGYIAIASFAGTTTASGINWRAWMMNFMAGFFLVFSAFKFLNLRGFADAYAGYDLLAKRWYGYGLVYPFLELGLGVAYLFRIAPDATNVATLVLMGFSSLGVVSALLAKRRIVCACLGTVLKLPMSTVTLVEDLGMAAMAAAMLLSGGHN